MPKDIRKLAKEFHQEPVELSNNHEETFLKKLNGANLEPKKTSRHWLYVAASVVVLLGLSVPFYTTSSDLPPIENQQQNNINLGDISPEMQKIENYYLTAINYEIASLEVTPDNKALLDEYFERISKLDADYKRLHLKLQKEGVTTQVIDALITNLQLRLQLLIQLKDQLQDLQTKQNNNEKYSI